MPLIESTGTWTGLIATAPTLLWLAVFQPLPWDSSNAAELLASMENLVLLTLAAATVWQLVRSPAALLRTVREPLFITCAILVVVIGIGVGASTPNYGSVARYRVLLQPFMVGMLVIAYYESSRVAARVKSQSPPVPLALLPQSSPYQRTVSAASWKE